MKALLLIGTLVFGNAIAANASILEQLPKELPTGTYIGKTYASKSCNVSVSTNSDGAYTVVITYYNQQKKTFTLSDSTRTMNVMISKDLRSGSMTDLPEVPSYVGSNIYLPKTNVAVQAGEKNVWLTISTLPNDKEKVSIATQSNVGGNGGWSILSCLLKR